MKNSITISILSYNRKEVIKELLNSLERINRKDLEIIVVDNFSTDGTSEMILEDFQDVRLIRLPRNIGTEGRNVGIVNARGNIVITIDDDIFGLNDGNIQQIETIFLKQSNMAALCFKVLDYYSEKVCNWCHPYEVEKFANSDFITTEITEGAVAFRKSNFHKIGLYSHHFFISHEGADLAARIIDNGFDIFYSPEIIVLHKYALGGRKNWRRYYYDTKNNFLLAIRNYRFLYGIKYLIFKTSSMMIYSIRDGFFLYWIKAIIDAFLILPTLLKERKPIKKETEQKITSINKHRPSILYFLKRRLKQKNVKI